MGSFVTASPHVPLPADRTNAGPPTGLTDEIDASHINDTQNAVNDLYTHTAGLVSALSYGVDVTGASDSTSAVLAAILAARSSGNAYSTVVQLPQGAFTISDTLLFGECYGLTFRGMGIGATRLYVTAAVAGKPIILLRNCQFCRVEDMTINGLTGSKPSVGIEIRNESGYSTGLSTKNTVRDVIIGDSGRLVSKGISMSGNVDGNNDFHTFERVQVYGATEADAAIDNTQSVGHEFIDCNFNGVAGSSKRGVWTAATRDRSSDDAAISPAPGGGTFHWRGGSCGGHTVSDFYPGGQGPGVLSVVDCNSESSYRFLDTPNLPGVYHHISLRNIRYSSMSGYQAADNIAFRWQYSGSFVLTESRFDQFGAGMFAKVQLTSAEPSTYRVTDNTWNQYGSFTADCIVKSYVAPTGSYPGGQYMGVESNLYLASDDITHWKGNTFEGVRYSDTSGTVVSTARTTGGTEIYDFSYSLLSVAALTRSINAFSIRAGYRLTSAVLKVVTPFAGVTTLTASLGTSGSPTNILLAGDMKAAAGTSYGLADADFGAAFTRVARVSNGYLPSMATDTQMLLSFTATGANLSALTAGSARLYLTLERVGE